MITIILLMIILSPDVSVTFDHNTNDTANRDFKFKRLASPVKDDVAASAKLTLIDGELDAGGAELAALTDGRLPRDEDEPGSNVYFRAGSSGGRFRMDFGSVIEITRVNTYSWHPNTRGPQLYKLYGTDGSDPKLNLDPKRGVDPATTGWKLIALVSTLSDQGEEGGQYAASVSGNLGKYRYLLFDCYVTELHDNWGNTFYSEIDVLGK
ncbi:MAG TPA: hypothetical protein VJM50_11735 [Pyrinomonadaceae bacterium]|nr:hypothetical protein [Pyrinomonadaceae bacterium]